MNTNADITDINTDSLQSELEQYKKDREKIKNVIGQIGGKASSQRDKFLNIFFIILIGILFILDLFRHLFNIKVPLPAMFSIELSILLVSIKIIWMIHKQSKVEHFQFWILHSIEYRLNEISNRINRIEKNK